MDYGIKAGQAGIGNIYYVCLSGSTIPYAYAGDHYQTTYLDGSTALQATITAALAASVTERNDYIIVAPDASDYDEGATLTIANTAVHLICPAGLGEEKGASMRAASIDPNTSAHAVTITGRGVEVGGFWLRGYDDKYCVHLSAGTATGCYVHHNDCAVNASSTLAAGIYLAGAVSGTRVANNYVFANIGGGTMVAGIFATNTCTRTHITENHIYTGGATCTVGISIGDGSTHGYVGGNILQEAAVCGGAGAGTFTKAITINEAGMAVDNRISMADPSNAISGGTAQNCVNNICSLDGGTIAQ